MVVLVMYVNNRKVFSNSAQVGLAIILSLFHGLTLANQFDDFITNSKVATYDCPSDDLIPQLDTFLADPAISPTQSIDLSVLKAHWLICVGQYQPAHDLLTNLLNKPAMNKSSYSYASAVYQIGFILDVQEDPKRCNYFRQAEDLGRQQYKDIFLSAQLSQITACGQKDQDIGLTLGTLFALLEAYVLTDDKQEVAHIHNSIGLLYGSIGQNVLAAEQYEKSYKIGLGVYEQKNQLATLISAISAYVGSGDFENSKRMIDELEVANKKVNTPLSNSWLHFAQSRYFYMTGDYAAMDASLVKWSAFLTLVSDKQQDALYAWYSTVVCLKNDDRACVKKFIAERAIEDEKNTSILSNNKDYLRFLVEANLYLGNISASKQFFARYADKLTIKLNQQQSSAQVLGVANLYTKINVLEANISKIQRQHIQNIVLVILLLTGLISLIYFTIGRNYLRKLATDTLTGLRNEQSVISEIKRVKPAINGKINAIAVFDVTNFTEVNSQFGYLTGDTLLKKVARCLTQVTREHDLLGRLGADRFIVCLKDIDDDTARVLFDRIQNSLTEMVLNTGSGEKVNVRSSMSMYLSAEGFQDVVQVLEDMRMSFSRNKTATVI
jgi:diguanylate cyclase (GGDEF)-like protein